jgi:ABC-type sugar transport system permease subunit
VIGQKRLTLGSSVISRRQYWGLIFVLPTVLFFLFFYIYPIISGIYLSLTDFTLLKPPVWVGLENYRDLLKDPLFLRSISATLTFVVGSTIPVWVLSLLAALLFYQKFPGRQIFKVLFFSPLLPSLVVVSAIWRVMLYPQGVLTTILRPLLGLNEIRWLNDIRLSPISMIIANDWAIIPFFMLIWLAGLTAIPEELRDAARVDGANGVQSFWFVELPMLRPTAVFVATISSINAFQAFTLQYILSPDRGGPIDVNTTFGLLIWKYGFTHFRMGDAAAISVVLFVIIMLVTVLQWRLGRSEDFSMH